MGNKVAIVLGSNIHWAPYYYRYEKMLSEKGISFDLVYWNRENIKEDTKANIVSFNMRDVSNNKNPFKVYKFMAFSSFVKRAVKENKYDKLVFLGTHGCAVSFCSSFLAKNYENKMWIDIRDDQYEWFPPFYAGEKKSIEASYRTAISSYRYTSFLPEHDYLYVHNIDNDFERISAEYKPVAADQIRISFIGNVRYYEQDKKLISLLGNDKRFKLQFYGKGSEVLEKYCKEKGINNTDFVSYFPPKETLHYYEQTDIINNNYGNNSVNLRTALSNKLYYSLLFHLPLLVTENTFMQELTDEYDMSFTFSESKDFADQLADWYQKIRSSEIKPQYGKLWDKVKSEDDNFVSEFQKFIYAD